MLAAAVSELGLELELGLVVAAVAAAAAVVVVAAAAGVELAAV